MIPLPLGRRGLVIGLAAVLLAGCGGSPAWTTGAVPQGAASGARVTHAGSWMKPGASGSDLLYINDDYQNVFVFTYPQGKLVGKLTGFWGPLGMCSDAQGDVFVTELGTTNGSKPPEILEYAHGGTSPINTLTDGDYYPEGCSVDPITGNLAVASARVRNPGSLAIFANAQGSPTFYTDPNIFEFWYCAYDNQGNLFASGGNNNEDLALAELSNGTILTDITLNKTSSAPAAIQWDGTYFSPQRYTYTRQYTRTNHYRSNTGLRNVWNDRKHN
jgi:hypothetical protein